MSLRDVAAGSKENEDPNEPQVRSSAPLWSCIHESDRRTVAYAGQAIRSFRDLQEFLSVYMFQAWCDAYVENAAYSDLCEDPDADPIETEMPTEAIMRRIINDSVGAQHVRRAFDYMASSNCSGPNGTSRRWTT